MILGQNQFFATNHTPATVQRWIEAHDREVIPHLLTLQGIYWNAICAALAQAHVDGESLHIHLEHGQEFIFHPEASNEA